MSAVREKTSLGNSIIEHLRNLNSKTRRRDSCSNQLRVHLELTMILVTSGGGGGVTYDIVGIRVRHDTASPIFPTDFKIPEIVDEVTTRVLIVHMYVTEVYSDLAESRSKSQSGGSPWNAPVSCHLIPSKFDNPA